MKAVALLLSALVSGWQSDPSGIGPDEFGRIVKGALADIEDLSFIYEGGKEMVAPGVTAADREKRRMRFQGSYTWRSDGSMLYDEYTLAAKLDMGFSRTTAATHGGKTEKHVRFPDRVTPSPIQSEPANPWLLWDCDAHIINFMWYYHWLPDPKSLNYRDLGWEVVDNLRCLKVQLDLSPSSNPNNSKYILWIDLERGANPLKVEHLVFPPDVGSRLHSVVLESFPTPRGKRVWLPASGIRDHFLVEGRKYVTYPIWTETCTIVRSSVVLNQGIADSALSVRSRDRASGSRELVLKREFDDQFDKSPPPVRNDPKSVEAKLRQQLQEADRQAAMIEAPSPARTLWNATLVAQGLFFVAGIAFIVCGVVVLRRSR